MVGWLLFLCILECVLACTNGPLAGTTPAGSTAAGFTACNSLTTGQICTYTCNAGYTAGAGFAVTCTAGNNYDANAATCTPNSCTGGIAPIAGSQVTGTPPATIATATNIALFLTQQAGFTCIGTPVALCATAGANTVTPTGYSCSANACTGGFTPPNGATLSGVALPPSIATNLDVSSYITAASGYSCTGTALGLCSVVGANAATATGYTCTGLTCTSVTAPTGSTVVTQGAYQTGDPVNLQTQAGYTCTGTSTALCTTAGTAAVVQGYTCTANTCTTGITPPTGSQVVGTPGAVTSGTVVTGFLTGLPGYTCTGTATAVCFTGGANQASVTGYSCAALQCASISAPAGGVVQSQVAATTGTIVTINLAAQAGYTCTGVATAMCGTANGVATTTGYTCAAVQCASIQAPTGATVATQQAASTGSIVTANLAAQAGYTCTGTATALCTTANGVATTTGYTCTPNACTGGITAPAGSTAGAVGSITTGSIVTASLTPNAGFSCTGTATALCNAVGANPVTVTGFTCAPIQCTSITAPAGAAVATQVATQTGSVITANLAPLTGFTCTGTATAVCNTAGGAATVTGYTCNSVQCASLQAPTGATVATAATPRTGDVVTANLLAAPGYTCVGTATASCPAANGVATTTGYTCTPNACTGGITAPAGSTAGAVGSITTGSIVTASLTPNAGFSCTGTATALCSVVGANPVTITGYTCAPVQCNSITAPSGASVATQAATQTGTIVTGNLQPLSGFTCTGTASALCNTAGGAATVTGYTCNANTCNSITAPAGATVATQQATTTGTVVTANLQPSAGFTCTGTATTTCLTAGGAATVSGYVCSSVTCATIAAPTGAIVATQTTATTGTIVTANLAAQAGYTCTGTATALCTTANGVATTTGYTCTPNACTGGITAPAGSTAGAVGSITTGSIVTASLTPNAGFSCTGTATALCNAVGANPVTVTGFTCALIQCTSITAPAGAAVATQAVTQTGTIVTANLAPLTGFTCTGTATAVCNTAGGAATVTGYTCNSVQCASLQAPTGATVATAATPRTGDVVTANLLAAPGYTCVGTATASCPAANGVATTTGYTCTPNACTGGITAPAGSTVTGVLPASITTGTILTAYLTPSAGFSCTGTPSALCSATGGSAVTVTGYTCSAPQCSTIQAPVGATVITQVAARTNDIVTTNLQQMAGYTCTGTASAVCTAAGGVATVTGYTCVGHLCSSITAPAGTSVATQVAARTGDVVTSNLVPVSGFTCTGTGIASCGAPNGAATVTGYACNANSCTGALTLPTGATLVGTAPSPIVTGTIVTGVLGPLAGYTCTGTATATCPTSGAGAATVSGYTCVIPGQCSSLAAPSGAVVITQGAVSPNADVTSRLQASPGYTCVGTALAVCGGSGVATTTGYTCNINTCTGGITAPTGSVSGTPPVSIATGTVISVLSPMNGYSCTGTPVALCSIPGANPVSVTGYSCVAIQCTSITAPTGTVVINQVATKTGDSVTNLQVQSGYTCTGVASALCTVANGAASVTGYTCTSQLACNSLQAPNGATVVTQVMPRTGDVVTANLQAVVGFSCTGTASAVCSTNNGVATTTGYTCTPMACSGGIQLPTGAVLSGVSVPAAIATGTDITSLLSPASGFTCINQAIAQCTSGGASQVIVTGYTCSQTAAQQCGSITPPVGALVSNQGTVTHGQVVTSRLQNAPGYVCSGTGVAQCTVSGGVASVSGYTCSPNACSGGIVVPAGAALSGVAVPASISTGANILSLLTPAAGFTCTTTATAQCAATGASAVTVIGYTCTSGTVQCNSLSAPAGAVVSTQGAVMNGAGVTTRLTAQAGFTCSGTAVAICGSAGGVATVSGFTCVSTTTPTCTSITAPTGAVVVLQTGASTGTDITANLQQALGYICSGTAIASCPSGSSSAVVTGSYSCTPNSCTGGINVPAGASLSGVAVPSPIVSGTDITSLLVAQASYTCVNTAVASCSVSGSGKVNVQGYQCIGTNQCSSFAAPVGTIVTSQGPVTSGEVVTNRLSPVGYVCTGTATALCSSPNGVATVSGYTCTPNSCSGGISLPAGSVLSGAQVPSVITSGMDITSLLNAAAGYMCVNAAIARCDTTGPGTVTASGYTCYTSGQCASLTAPVGTTVTGQGAISNGDNVLNRLQTMLGYTCTGTPTAVCSGGTATVAGYTCSGNTCSGGLTVPLGSTASSNTPSSLATGSSLTSLLTSQPGYSCHGSPLALCRVTGQAPSEVSGYSCISNQCFSIAAPAGATVVGQSNVFSTGDIVSSFVSAAAGYVCTGTAMAVCNAQLGQATTTGYTCTPNVCSSVQAPVFMTLIGNPSSVTTGDTLGSSLTPLSGYTCTGTPVVLCHVGNAVATVTGMQCTAIACNSGATPPNGATTTITAGQQLTTGQDVTQFMAAVAGYSCSGNAVVTCTNQAAAATISGYTCTNVNTCIVPKLPGYLFSGGAQCTTLSQCGTVSCASGYNGVASATCTGSTVVLAGCIANQCNPPASQYVGYVLQGGLSCTTVQSCGAVTCASGYTQVSVPTITCATDKGSFLMQGCVENTCQAPSSVAGYAFTNPACTKTSTCGVTCAAGYTGTPVVTCITNGGNFLISGCAPSTQSTVSVPNRPWKRVRMTVIPNQVLSSSTEESAFVISLEKKLSLSYGRFTSGVAELVVTLMCPVNSNNCFRPQVSWKTGRDAAVLQVQQPEVVDIIVADNTVPLVDEDIRNLRLALEQNELKQGPVYTGKPEFPLTLTSAAASNLQVAVPDSLAGGATQGGTPVTVQNNSNDDGSSFPWWAIVLLVIAVLLVCAAIALLLFCTRKKEKETTREEYKENDMEMSQYGDTRSHYDDRSRYQESQGSWRRDGREPSTSLAEGVKARQLQEEINQLERQKAEMDTYDDREGSGVGSGSGMGSDVSVPFKQWGLNDSVEVLYSGQWFPAKINSSNCDQDGCWDVDWMDGTGSRGISYRDIRPPGGWEAQSVARSGG